MLKQLLVLAAAAVVITAHHANTAHADAHPCAIVRLASPTGQQIQGNITFTTIDDGKVHITGTIFGLPPGQYGFHVHEKGDITGGCGSTGGHFNPENQPHGHPNDQQRHVGDLGNIVFDENHVSTLDFYDGVISVTGPHGILGRAVVLHEKEDDYGRSDHPDSRKTGNAGGRVACGVIGILGCEGPKHLMLQEERLQPTQRLPALMATSASSSIASKLPVFILLLTLFFLDGSTSVFVAS